MLSKFFFFFVLLIVSPILLYSQVTLKAPQIFALGEEVSFFISASGEKIKFPSINNIDGIVVQKTGTSSNIRIVNGIKSQSITQVYRFYPTTDINIPSFEVLVDGKIEQTLQHKILLKEIAKTKSNDFDLSIKLNKDKIFVGEEVVLTMIFKYKKDIKLYDLQFTLPSFENFWSKEINTNSKSTDNLYVVQELNFLLFPQKSGNLQIDPFQIIAVLPYLNTGMNFFRTNTKNKKIYSNKLNINVMPLPKNITLVGDFKIKTNIDKNSIKIGEAVSLQLEISGRGNIDDLEEFTLDIQNATIYDNKSTKDFNIVDGKYGGIYKKSYSIVASDDFVIPSITLQYFDKTINKVKTIKTKSYNIKVKGDELKQQKLEVKIKPTVINKIIETSDNQKIIFFFIGLVSGMLILIVYRLIKNKPANKQDIHFLQSIKHCSTQEELLKQIAPYVNIDKNLDDLIYQIESSSSLNLKKIKKEIIDVFKAQKNTY